MRDISRQDMIEMALNMLQQAKIAQKSCDDIIMKTCDNVFFNRRSNSRWAKSIYNIVRSAVSIIEMTNEDLKILSEKEFVKVPVKEDRDQEDDNNEDDYDE